jgi:hydroxyacylglutathione hydrolase
MLSIKPIKAFSDNYIWLVSTNEGSIVIDPGEANQILNLIESKDIDLKGILITHHHYDHTNGLEEILKQKQVEVYGPVNNIDLINKRVSEGDEINIIGLKFKVIEVPAHTLDHVAFIHEDETMPFIFCGDTLFSGGCGRVFEGTFEQMFSALQKIKKLPSNTKIFCGHEYTVSNLEFACVADPTNDFIPKYLEELKEKVSSGEPSLPSNLETEYKINPFLRCDNEFIKDRINDKFGETKSEIEIFTALRKWKDNF